jgi:hypothetical protein
MHIALLALFVLTAVVTMLGVGAVRVAVLTLGTIVLGAVIMALTAVMFSFNLGTSSRHFFFWLHLPCPGPGIAEKGD